MLVNHCSSQIVEAMDMYSASVELRDTVGCFLDFQEIREYLRQMQKPVINLRVSEQVAKSEYEKALSCREELL